MPTHSAKDYKPTSLSSQPIMHPAEMAALLKTPNSRLVSIENKIEDQATATNVLNQRVAGPEA